MNAPLNLLERLLDRLLPKPTVTLLVDEDGGYSIVTDYGSGGTIERGSLRA